MRSSFVKYMPGRGWRYKANQPRQSWRPTHFLSIPLITPQSSSKFQIAVQEFAAGLRTLHETNEGHEHSATDVRGQRRPNEARLPREEMIKPTGSLHLTLGALHLRSPNEVERAVRHLRELDIEQMLTEASPAPSSSDSREFKVITEGSETGAGQRAGGRPTSQPLVVSRFTLAALPLRGKPQNSIPTSARVLYLQPHEPTGRLLPFCESIVESFRQAGIMTPLDPDGPTVRDQLTLHGSILNTNYVQPYHKFHSRGDDSVQERSASLAETSQREGHDPLRHQSRTQGRGKWIKHPRTFDPRPILEQTQLIEWPQNLVLDRLSMCEMGCRYTWDQDGQYEDGYYHEVCTRNLPSMGI